MISLQLSLANSSVVNLSQATGKAKVLRCQDELLHLLYAYRKNMGGDKEHSPAQKPSSRLSTGPPK